MTITKVCFTFLILINSLNIYAQIDNEANFYSAIGNADFNKNLVSAYPVDKNFNTNDSVLLLKTIDAVFANGRGFLTISNGNYSFRTINVKSNAYIKIYLRTFKSVFYFIRVLCNKSSIV